MDLPSLVALDIKNLNDDTKNQIANILIDLDIENTSMPKKHLKKMVQLAIIALNFKDKQMIKLEDICDQLRNATSEENTVISKGKSNDSGKHKHLLNKLESDKNMLKSKVKELTEEVGFLHRRLQDKAPSGSEKDDSSDVLSELDKKEELLKNISKKNKHIKRLLSDIEKLEKINIEQSKIIIELESKFSITQNESTRITKDLSTYQEENKILQEKIENLYIEKSCLEENIEILEDERNKTDTDLKSFVSKYEEKALTWKNIIDEKESQLDSLKTKYDELINRYPDKASEKGKTSEKEKLIQAISDRDILIEELESKLKTMADEMLATTQLMNKLSMERESERTKSPRKQRSCCQHIEDLLNTSNQRCKELAEMLEVLEDDNIQKSKQANDAIMALKSYRDGEDGLPQALRKNFDLEQKISSRDKQIKALVMEINSLQEISQENIILRKKLDIPDDMVLSTRSMIAKERSKDKIIDRLTLKLRASEEIRLQLQLELNALRKIPGDKRENCKIFSQEKNNFNWNNVFEEENVSNIALSNKNKEGSLSHSSDVLSSEIGGNFVNILEENQSLRTGLQEILERIREYNSNSNHIIIDSAILEKILNILKKSCLDKANIKSSLVSQNFDHEETQKDQINQLEVHENTKVSSSSVEEEAKIIEPDVNFTSSLSCNEIKDEVPCYGDNTHMIEKYRQCIIENDKLKIYEIQYKEMLDKWNSSENGLTTYTASVVEKLDQVQHCLVIQKNQYNFLKEDYENALAEYKKNEINNASIISDLKLQLSLEKQKSNSKIIINDSNVYGNFNELESLKVENFKVKDQLVNVIKRLFSETYDPNLIPFEGNLSYGIVTDDLVLDYITFSEFKKQSEENLEVKNEIENVKAKCLRLEVTLETVQEEVEKYKKLLSNITDTQVNLRHLVADLQSSDEDKFILSKAHRDLEEANREKLKFQNEATKLEKANEILKSKLEEIITSNKTSIQSLEDELKDNKIKTRFFKKSLELLYDKYWKFTPLILLVDYILSYREFVNRSRKESELEIPDYQSASDLNDDTKLLNSQETIKLVQLEIKCKMLEEEIIFHKKTADDFRNQLNELRITTAEESEHWRTVRALFGTTPAKTTTQVQQTQTDMANFQDSAVNTESIMPKETFSSNSEQQLDKITNETNKSIKDMSGYEVSSVQVRSLESQLKQAMMLVSTRSEALISAESKVIELEAKAKEMQVIIDEKNRQIHESKEDIKNTINKTQPENKQFVESAIESLQSILEEKDKVVLHYQELLKSEREQYLQTCTNYEKELQVVRKTLRELEDKLKRNENEANDLRIKLKRYEEKSQQEEQLCDIDQNSDDEISDQKLEEMFLEEHKNYNQPLLAELKQDKDVSFSKEHSLKLEKQLREANNKERLYQQNINEKDEEILLLKDRIVELKEEKKDHPEHIPQVVKLKNLIEEKDKQINDLMETLGNLQDDQQKFITETSLYSSEHLSQLSVDLSRSEATNRILSTQIEVLRKQLSSLSHREKQARELAHSLKTQLIQRPIISIRSEAASKVRSEQLQKRINQLEIELENCKEENKKQLHMLESKRAKSAEDLALWEKQKKWQQNAEKFKTKLTETEAELERTKELLASARKLNVRYEKEKHAMSLKMQGCKCCRTPSCPNLHSISFCGQEQQSISARSECSGRILKEASNDLVNAMKLRIDSQQRKINALELETKGSNAVTTELERLQEKVTSLEAENIRSEARNLQLQLKLDMIYQSNDKDRLQKRITYLEEYTSKLNEELNKIQRKNEEYTSDSSEKRSDNISQHEQTIKALRTIIERIKSENKSLKEGRKFDDEERSAKVISDLENKLRAAMEKITHKSELLQKAKILLTRAAAKEKQLKDQIEIWKRKCSELQNVPVIEETSE